MIQGDPLANLHDIHLPDPVSAWPPAPGWWVLAVMLLLITALLAGWAWQRWRRRRYRRAAIRALGTSYRAYQTSGQDDAASYLRDASHILKQAALAGFPRERVAAVHGDAWPDFLVESGGDAALRGPAGELLAAVYQPTVQADPEQLRQLQRLLEDWLRSHRC